MYNNGYSYSGYVRCRDWQEQARCRGAIFNPGNSADMQT